MIALDRLKEATQQVLESVDCINQEVNNEIWDKAPVIVHQRLCAELVNLAQKHPCAIVADIPNALNVITAINILEELYPKLKQ